MGNKVKNPNKAASELSAQRWKKTTPEQRTEILSHVSRAGWTPEQKAKRLLNAGRKKDPNRCPCGAMTRARAEKRGHKCTA